MDPYKGRWAFPGGFLKMDESAEDGALSELRRQIHFEPIGFELLPEKFTFCLAQLRLRCKALCIDGSQNLEDNVKYKLKITVHP